MINMKKIISIRICVLTLLIVGAIMPIGASAAGDFAVTHSFSSNPAKLGESVTATITNNAAHQAKIVYAGLHLDWMGDGRYYSSSQVSSTNPAPIASGETKTFYIYFRVPYFEIPIESQSGIAMSAHDYDIRLDYYLQDGWFGEWSSHPYTKLSTFNERNFRVIDPTASIYDDPARYPEESPVPGATLTVITFIGVCVLLLKRQRGEK